MRYPLPYAFARTARLLLEDDGHALTLWHDGQPDASALSEVMRRYGSAPLPLALSFAPPSERRDIETVLRATGLDRVDAIGKAVEAGSRPSARRRPSVCAGGPPGSRP